jgi:hypothetical protein
MDIKERSIKICGLESAESAKVQSRAVKNTTRNQQVPYK